MLYELLTGRMPIEGKPLQIIFKKQTETPREPCELEPSIPPELNDLCVALLKRDPTKRPDVFEILRCIGAEDLACRPHALRESGIIAAMEGNADQAHRSFMESLAVSEKHEARYNHAETRLAQAEAGLKFGWPGSTEQAAEVRMVIRELETVE